MKRFVLTLSVALLLGLGGPAGAACRRFGTQVDCDVGRTQVLIGTQTQVPERTYGGLRLGWLQPSIGFRDDRTISGWPLRIEIQNFGAQPASCRQIGNERYCY